MFFVDYNYLVDHIEYLLELDLIYLEYPPIYDVLIFFNFYLNFEIIVPQNYDYVYVYDC